MKKKPITIAGVALAAALAVCSTFAYAQGGVTVSTQNPRQVALMRWYGANQTTQFQVRNSPYAFVFDGSNAWVANYANGTVSKLRVGLIPMVWRLTEPIFGLPICIARPSPK